MAYNSRQRLSRQAKDLDAMRKDLDTADFRIGVDWDATVNVKHTFGRALAVERWALVEQFLITWMDWSGAVNRWNRYFGQAESAWPESLWQVADRCGWRASALLRDGDLIARLRKSLTDSAIIDVANQGRSENVTDVAAADTVVHRLLANDARLRLAGLLHGQQSKLDEELLLLLKGLDRRIAGELEMLAGDAAEIALTHIGTFRHSTLRLSCHPSGVAGFADGHRCNHLSR